MTTLALKYRPKTFDDVVGQNHIIPILRAMVIKDAATPALLFAGSRGTGKTTTGRILAAAFNCKDRDDRGNPCGTCPSCLSVQSGNSMSVIEVDAASNGLVADIRKIKEAVMYQTGGDWRVVLLDEAHSMSKEAFNALLKVLEEPPANTIFILLTTEPNKILETVVSRCMSFEFRRLTEAQISKRLAYIVEQEELEVEADLIAEIARRVQGGMRDAVMLLDQVSRVGVTSVSAFNDMFGYHNISIPLLRSALAGDHNTGSQVIDEYFYKVGDAGGLVNDLILLVRDLLVIKSGGQLTLSDSDVRERQSLAASLSADKLVGVIKVLWDVKSRVRYVDNDQRAAIYMSYVLITEVVASDNVTPMSGRTGQSQQKVTLAQMMESAHATSSGSISSSRMAR